MKTKTTHPCDICQTPIGRSLLMCSKHWHLVPKDLQDAVYRTWGRVSRKADPHTKLQHIAAYRQARDAAVAAAQACADPISTTTKEGVLP